MTLKSNPGCNIPIPKEVLDLEDFINNLAINVASKLVVPSGAVALAVELEQTIEDLNRIRQAAEDEVKRRRAQIEKYLKISCPLPDVKDSDAE